MKSIGDCLITILFQHGHFIAHIRIICRSRIDFFIYCIGFLLGFWHMLLEVKGYTPTVRIQRTVNAVFDGQPE